MSKICFYLESYYVGGLDTFTIDLINNWPNKNDELFLICNKSHTAINLYRGKIKNINASLVLHNLPMVPEKQDKLKEIFGSGLTYKIFSVAIQYTLFIYYTLFSFRILNLKKYDELMIINGGYPAGPSCRAISIAWGRNTGKKSIHNFHNYAVRSKRIVAPIENLIDSIVCKYTSCYVSVSKSCSASIRNRPSIESFDKINYIHNGINDQILKPKNSIKNELQIDEKTKICLMLATYEKRKGHGFLFQTFKSVSNKCPDAVLICCGYGTDSELLLMKELAIKSGLEKKIFILGFREDAMELLAQSDVLLIASQAFESFGLTAVEAMKYKKPVVSTNVGGLSEVIKNNEGGYLFDAADTIGYANKIIELLNNPNLLFNQGERGYNRYKENFQIKRVALEYYALFNNN